MPSPRLKGRIRNAFGRLANKFRRTKKQPNYSNSVKTQQSASGYNGSNAEALIKHHSLAHEEYQKLIEDVDKKIEDCETNLGITTAENEKKQTEINELKAQLKAYSDMINTNEKQVSDLKDELEKCTTANKETTHKQGGGSSHRSSRKSRKQKKQTIMPIQKDPIKQPGDINYMTGDEMYTEYIKLKEAATGNKITTWQRKFVNSIDGYINKLVRDGRTDLKTDKAKEQEIRKILNRWQTYNPNERMQVKLVGEPNKLVNNRPDGYIWYQGHLYRNKLNKAFNNNNFVYPGYGTF